MSRAPGLLVMTEWVPDGMEVLEKVGGAAAFERVQASLLCVRDYYDEYENVSVLVWVPEALFGLLESCSKQHAAGRRTLPMQRLRELCVLAHSAMLSIYTMVLWVQTQDTTDQSCSTKYNVAAMSTQAWRRLMDKINKQFGAFSLPTNLQDCSSNCSSNCSSDCASAASVSEIHEAILCSFEQHYGSCGMIDT